MNLIESWFKGKLQPEFLFVVAVSLDSFGLIWKRLLNAGLLAVFAIHT